MPDHGTFQNSLKTKFSLLKVKISHNLKALVVWVLVKTDIFKHSFVLFFKIQIRLLTLRLFSQFDAELPPQTEVQHPQILIKHI